MTKKFKKKLPLFIIVIITILQPLLVEEANAGNRSLSPSSNNQLKPRRVHSFPGSCTVSPMPIRSHFHSPVRHQWVESRRSTIADAKYSALQKYLNSEYYSGPQNEERIKKIFSDIKEEVGVPNTEV